MSTKGMTYNISPEGKKIRAETGTQNLLAWQKENPAGGKLTHGVQSRTIRKRYSDKRTTEGKTLASIIDSIVNDLGGPEDLNSGQQLILSGVQTKLIVILQISKYVESMPDFFNQDGRLISVLENSFLKYQESLEKSLANLYKTVKPQVRVPSIEELIARKKE